MDGDEEALGVEAVHLDEPVVVGSGTVDDDEDEVVVVVDLRALAEVLGVLDRERVELEDVAEDREVARVGAIEVEPEELPAREQALDRLAIEVDLLAPLVIEDEAASRIEGGLGCGLLVAGFVLDGRPARLDRGPIVGHAAIVSRSPSA